MSWQKTKLHNTSANQQAITRIALQREVYLAGVMTEAGVSRKSDLEMGEAGDGRSDTRMDVAMEMAMEVTHVAAKTVGATIVEPIEGNENREQRRRRECKGIRPCMAS